MADFLLEPDDIEPESRPVGGRSSLVGSGLAPTAEVPASAKRGPAPAPCHVPCEACGHLVVRGKTVHGVPVVVDLHRPMYVVTWTTKTPEPVMHLSRGYPAHACQPGSAQHEE